MKEKQLALTFDDGPNTGTMVQILDLLDRFGAKATFFVVGSNITAESAPVVREACRRGHEIGNHGWNHLHMTRLEAQQAAWEVSSLQTRVEGITGKAPALFRPPYIDVDEALLKRIPMPFISGSGNNDWDAACTVEQRIEGALRDARDGAILLMHCFEKNDATVEALKTILPELQRRGYRMVTVSRLFAEKGIPLKPGILYDAAHNAFPRGEGGTAQAVTDEGWRAPKV